MAYIEWKNVCSVSVKELDDQHKILFALVNDYHDAISRGANAKDAKNVLQGLIRFAHAHFGDEEKMMLRHDYPGFAAQKAQHSRFVTIIGDYLKRADEGRPAPPAEISDFLRYWVIKHVLAEDRRYGPFLNAQGVN